MTYKFSRFAPEKFYVEARYVYTANSQRPFDVSGTDELLQCVSRGQREDDIYSDYVRSALLGLVCSNLPGFRKEGRFASLPFLFGGGLAEVQEESCGNAGDGGEAHDDLMAEAALAHLPGVDPEDGDENCGERGGNDPGVGSAVDEGGGVSAGGWRRGAR